MTVKGENGMSDGHADGNGVEKSGTGVLLSLRRGLHILEAIATSNGAATAKALSHDTGIKIGTCYHILRTLEDDGYVVRLPGSRFGLGSRVAFLHDNFRAHLAPPPELLDILSQLHEEVGETSYISGWYGGSIVLQRYVDGTHAVHVRSLEIGYAGFAHARASGKAILAFLPEDRVRSYLTIQRMARRTMNTITDPEALIDHLRDVARAGHAFDREEFADGVSCVSAAVFDRSNFPIGAYTVSLPSSRFEERLSLLIGAVRRAGVNASVAMGYLGTYPPASPLLDNGR
jgi:DNA-binding IclR family transcriptional regulator